MVINKNTDKFQTYYINTEYAVEELHHYINKEEFHIMTEHLQTTDASDYLF